MENSPGGPKRRGRPRSFDREAALERAMEVFWRQGYEATSIAELTAAMGINPPSLYAAFGDKERLFLEAVERYRCGVGDPSPAVEKAPTARAAVERLLEGSAEELTRATHPPGCMLVTAAMNCSSASAHLQRALAEHRAASEARIKALVERGVAEGDLPEATDVAALARFFMTVIAGMTIQARDGATREELLAVAEAAMRAWPSAPRRERRRE
jgi:AcrR family transcriptional regulator